MQNHHKIGREDSRKKHPYNNKSRQSPNIIAMHPVDLWEGTESSKAARALLPGACYN